MSIHVKHVNGRMTTHSTIRLETKVEIHSNRLKPDFRNIDKISCTIQSALNLMKTALLQTLPTAALSLVMVHVYMHNFVILTRKVI